MEPRWSDRPPTPNALPYLPLERIKPGVTFRGLITSHTVLGVMTHFLGGRTLACIEGECPGCLASQPARWEGYLSVLTPSPSRHIIIAITPGAAMGIADSATDPAALRGSLVILERGGKRPNSRLRARVEQAEAYGRGLPPAPDLKAHLIHIWGLDQSHTAQDHPDYVNRVKEFYKGNGQKTDANSAE